LLAHLLTSWLLPVVLVEPGGLPEVFQRVALEALEDIELLLELLAVVHRLNLNWV
jgi:hypothetical protein